MVVLFTSRSVSIPVPLTTCFNFLDVFHHQRGLRSVRSELVLAKSQCVLSGRSFSAGADLLKWTSLLPSAVDIPCPTELLPDCVCEKTFSRTWVDRLSTTLACASEGQDFRHFLFEVSVLPNTGSWRGRAAISPAETTRARVVTTLKKRQVASHEECRVAARDKLVPLRSFSTASAKYFGRCAHSLSIVNYHAWSRPHFLRFARWHSPRPASRRPSGSRDSSISLPCSSFAISVVSKGARRRGRREYASRFGFDEEAARLLTSAQSQRIASGPSPVDSLVWLVPNRAISSRGVGSLLSALSCSRDGASKAFNSEGVNRTTRTI